MPITVSDFISRYTARCDETRDGHDFWRDLVELVGTRDAYDTYEPQFPVQHAWEDPETGEKHVEPAGHPDFYSEEYGVVVELKGGEYSIASQKSEFPNTYEGTQAWMAVREPRPRAWDKNRRVTPFKQAKDYADDLTASGHSVRYIVVSNFHEIRVYEYLNAGRGDVRATEEVIRLEGLGDKLGRLAFLASVDEHRASESVMASRHAGELMRELRGHVERCWALDGKALDGERRISANVFCLRIAFLLFAEDAMLLGNGGRPTGHEFADWLSGVPAEYLDDAFRHLFEALDTPDDRRVGNRSENVTFPYVNGSLFSCDADVLAGYGLSHGLLLPVFDDEFKEFIVERASRQTDWHKVDPTVFGSIFECLVGDADKGGERGKRREQGMHYTSVENIHKVIDPLFMDALEDDLARAEGIRDIAERKSELDRLKTRISRLQFLDPACGSGNFLVETYKCLRGIENRIVMAYQDATLPALPPNHMRESTVSASSFFGVELDPLAGAIARTSLHMMALAMNVESSGKSMFVKNFPLDSTATAHIVTGVNALTSENGVRDWLVDFTGGVHMGNVVKNYVDYIIGNPPFVGYSMLDADQKRDRELVFEGDGGMLDYVTCWFELASRYIEASGGKTRSALVATNSICQGQQVEPLWRRILEGRGQEIDFAWPSFRWESESTEGVAAVTVVVVGFGATAARPKRLLSVDKPALSVGHVNGYLKAGPDIWVGKRGKPLCADAPVMVSGLKPADHNRLLLTAEEREELLGVEPQSARFVRRFSMGAEFVKGEDRYCLWLVNADLDDLQRNHPWVWDRVEQCRRWRLEQKQTGDAYKLRDAPHLLRGAKTVGLSDNYIAIPVVSSENRSYMPIGFVVDGMIPGNKLFCALDADVYQFGILQSQAHNAWMRVVSGRLESRYSYSNTIVYNNFPWPECDEVHRKQVEHAAIAVLAARDAHAGRSLAQMYDGISPLPENPTARDLKKYDLREYDDLKRAHEALDAAVEAAYGVDSGGDEEAVVAHLLELYSEMAEG